MSKKANRRIAAKIRSRLHDAIKNDYKTGFAVDNLGCTIEFLKEYVEVLYPDSAFSGIYGRLEAALRKTGTPVPTMDLLIATTAIMKSMPLITNNVKDYKPIPGLIIETY